MKGRLRRGSAPIIIVAVVLGTALAAYRLSCDWQVAAAVGTGAAALITAIIVYWYTLETRQLRKVAEQQVRVSQNQAEASIAPLLLLSKESPTSFPVIREMDLTRNRRGFSFTIYNAGKGAAVRGRITTSSSVREDLEPLGLGPSAAREEQYVLSPIPAGTAVTVSLAEETLASLQSGASDLSMMWLDFKVHYESASGRAYSTRVRTQSLYFDDAIVVEYGQAAKEVR